MKRFKIAKAVARARDAPQSGDLATTVYRLPHWANYYGPTLHFGFFLPTSTPGRVAPCRFVRALYSFCFFSALHFGTFYTSHSSIHLPSPTRFADWWRAVLTVRSLQGYQSCRTLIPPFAPPINFCFILTTFTPDIPLRVCDYTRAILQIS